jgi:transposase InsO family protein
LREDLPFTALCAEYGISPKTGYKWKERFLRDGALGLNDHSRRPRRCPRQVPEELLLELIKLKTLHPAWGPKKLRELLQRMQPPLKVPALSTLKRLLMRAGLVKPQRRRRVPAAGRITQNLVAGAPNQVWTVDFKGWWYSAERERIEPLTVRDEFSRYVLCAQILRGCADRDGPASNGCSSHISLGDPERQGQPFASAARRTAYAWWWCRGSG